MLKKLNEFKVFDAEQFLKGKRFAIKKVEEKMKYDEEQKEYTDERDYILVVVEIVQDNYKYAEGSQYEQVGANKGEEFSVKIYDEDADVEEYAEMMGDGFNRHEVLISNPIDAYLREEKMGQKNSKTGYQAKNVTLSMQADIKLKA